MPLAFLLYEFFRTYIEKGVIFCPKRMEKWERRIWRDPIQNRRIGIEYAEIGIYCEESFSREESRGNAAACITCVRTHGGKIRRNARATKRTVESDSRTDDSGIFSILLRDVPFFRGKMLDSATVGRAYLPVSDFSREPTRHSTIRRGWLVMQMRRLW